MNAHAHDAGNSEVSKPDGCPHGCPHGLEGLMNPRRRRFCQVCIGVLSATSVAMVGYPIVAFMQRPQRLDASKPLDIPLSSLTLGQAQYLDLHGQQIIVVLGESGPRVFSASCPHLGCNVLWDSGEKVFRCPCHGAMFNAAGDVIRGPVSGTLTKVPFEVKDGKIIVS